VLTPYIEDTIDGVRELIIQLRRSWSFLCHVT
jgi:hypothetical protein